MSRVALIVTLVLGLTTVASVSQAEEPTVSRALAKPLSAANEALKAKNWAEVLNKTREAAAISPRTAYDDFLIHSMQMAAYGAQGNYSDTATAIESIIDSPYQAAANKPQLLRTLMSIYYQDKNYDKAIQYGVRTQAAGDSSEDTALIIAQAYYLNGKYREAMNGLDSLVSRAEQGGRKPSEKNLNLIWNCAVKLKDEAAASKVVEKLILNYPKPDYWSNAMSNVLANRTNDDHLLLLTYRLMAQVGILKRGADFREMAQIALDQGNPGEAQSILEQAFAKNLYTEQRDKDSNQRLLDAAKKKATEDRASIAKDEKAGNAAATGDPLVQIGAAYLGFGQVDKAVASISAGIAKGQLKHPDEAYMLLGIAQDRAKNSAEAVKAFNKATTDPKYARLAKLWVLEARS
jgi:Tfp pilus assembly protein PilF